MGTDHTRGNLGDRSEPPREKTSEDSSKSADGVLFRPQDMDDNRGRLAGDKGISQSAGVVGLGRRDTNELSPQVDNGDTLAMGETSLPESDIRSELRPTSLSSGETTRNGNRGIHESITSTEHSEPDTIRSIGSDGNKPESILPSMDRTKRQNKFTSKQHVGDSDERTPRESSRGGLLNSQALFDDSSEAISVRSDEQYVAALQKNIHTQNQQAAQIDFSSPRQVGEAQSLVSDESIFLNIAGLLSAALLVEI